MVIWSRRRVVQTPRSNDLRARFHYHIAYPIFVPLAMSPRPFVSRAPRLVSRVSSLLLNFEDRHFVV